MEPLAATLRPKTLQEYLGQEHLVGEGKPLKKAIDDGHLFSFILWGPPGVGKTTLARIYANAFKDVSFHELSAVSAGKADVREVVGERGSSGNMFAQKKILFLDEIHRFNKAQQDFLLPYVEDGSLVLIGATTENPSFEVIPALLSRCRVFTLNSLSPEQMQEMLSRTGYELKEDALAWLVEMADGDGRQALSVLGQAHALYDELTVETLKETLQSKFLRYDKKGEEHYNTISAFIKSMRASQPDAALYYLTRMLEAGEDPKFIARRMVIFASEDVGMAQSTALVVANEVFKAVEVIGLPECAINLAHGVTYLATAKKDRRSYDALRAAESDVKNFGNLPIPKVVRNAPTKLMKDEGYGDGYEMYPDTDVDYRPEELWERPYYTTN